MLVDGHIFVEQINGLDLNASPADLGLFLVPAKFELLQVGVHPRADVAGAPRVKFDVQLANLGARGDGDAGDVTCTANTGGQITYDEAGRQIIDAGSQIVVQLITAAGGALTGDVYIVGRWLSDIPGNEADLIETA